MKITAIAPVEVPAFGLVIEPGKEVELPEDKAAIAAHIGKEVRDVTDEDVRAVHDQILANPYVRVVGQPSSRVKAKPQGSETDA